MGSFTLDMERFLGREHSKREEAVKKTATEVFSRIIQRTPVDTGRARANWTATIGNQTAATSEHVDPTGSGAIAVASAVVAGWDHERGSVWLSNNLPYIGRLEYGHSKQAPVGMVGVTVAEFGGIANEAAR